MIYKGRYGDNYDLSKWSKEHLDFIRRAYWHYANDMDYTEFISFILGPNSPVLKQKVPKPTKTPLYKVATDLQFRLAVKQGVCLKDWEGEIDPEWPLND